MTAPTPESTLDLARDRDAFGAIRGFVYQADLTIARWVDLPDGDVLELERGEDIDRVARYVAADPAERERLLEQVKYRVARVSLASEALRAALANFYEHARRNVGLALRFCFTTNAPPARERKSALPAGRNGIEVWNALRTAAAFSRHERTLLAAVRRVLAHHEAPTGVRDESWRAWQQFVRRGRVDDVVAFIRRVELVVGAPDAQGARGTAIAALVERGHAATRDAAARLYARLFVAVFRRLTNPGLKRLTPDDLRAEVRADRAGAPDAGERQLAERIGAVLDVVARQDTRLAELAAGLDALRSEVRIATEAVRAERFPPAAHAGDTRTYQLTDHALVDQLTTAPTFHHARELVGRGTVLDAALDAVRIQLAAGGGSVVAVCAAGGKGKTRLLLEAARRLAADGDAAVRWVRPDVTPDPGSLQELPDGPVVLVCDDAHGRADLAAVLRTAQSRREPTVVVAGVRPQGREAVRAAAYAANVGFERIAELPDLPDLDLDALAPLVAAELGPEFAGLAERVLYVTHHSPLVALVGARLLRTRRVHPEALAQDAEFRQAVLQGFRDEAVGRVGGAVASGVARRVLDVLAAVQPFDPSADAEVAAAAQLCGAPASEVQRVVGALEDAGVLRHDPGGVRITPDVLGDDVLARAMVAGGNQPTGFDREVLDALGPSVLPRLVRNVAELDWQLAEGGRRVDVFGTVWDRFAAAFRNAANPDRQDLLDQLPPVAAFQPARVLAFVRWLVEHPAGEERSTGTLSIRVRDADVLAKVPRLLAIIAQHRPHVGDALDLLWRLGRSDVRLTNQHPEHAMRQLADVVAYARHRHLWMQETAVDAFERWTAAPGWSRGAHSPRVVADKVLAMAMVEDRWNERTREVTMTRRGVHGANTRALRERTIAILERLAAGPDAHDRQVAVDVLVQSLEPPPSELGHVVTPAEEEGFRAQYEAALAALERLTAAAHDSLTRVRVRDGLAWRARRTPLAWKRARIEALRDRLPEDEGTRRVRAIARLAREFAGAGATERARRLLDEATDAVARELLALGGEDALARALDAECRALEDAGVTPEPGFVLGRIDDLDSATGVGVAAWALAAADGAAGLPVTDDAAERWAGWLTSVLPRLRASQPAAYGALLRAAVESPRARERRAAAAALGRADAAAPWDDRELGYMRALLGDAAAEVRRAAAYALWWAPAAHVAALLSAVRVGGDLGVVQALARCWAHRKREERPQPDAVAMAGLLEQLVEVPQFGQAADDVDHMLAAFARQDPGTVIDFLLARVRRELAWRAGRHEGAEDAVDYWNARYDAVPYDGFDRTARALCAGPGYAALVRQLLEAAAGPSGVSATRVEAPTVAPGDAIGDTLDGVPVGPAAEQPAARAEALELLGSLAVWDDEIARGLLELVTTSRGCAAHPVVVAVVEQQSTGFLVSQHAFVGALLTATARCEAAVQEAIRRALFDTVSGEIRVRPVGEDDPSLVQVRDGARAVAAAIAAATSAAEVAKRAFYHEVAAHAQELLDEQRDRDTRLGGVDVH